MGKGDHIVIPKSILKRFCGEDGKVSCLDILKKEVYPRTPDSVFTQVDYYNDEIDKYIKDEVETNIGILYKKISSNMEIPPKVEKQLLDSMKKIFVIQYFRNNKIPIDMVNSSQFIKYSSNDPKKISHNFVLYEIIKHLDGYELDNKIQLAFDKISNLHKKLTPGVLILRNTIRTFIIPASQFIFLSKNGREVYIYPISPNICIKWEEKEEKNIFCFEKIESDEFIEKINIITIKQEIKKNIDNIVIGTHEEISKLQGILSTEDIMTF